MWLPVRWVNFTKATDVCGGVGNARGKLHGAPRDWNVRGEVFYNSCPKSCLESTECSYTVYILAKESRNKGEGQEIQQKVVPYAREIPGGQQVRYGNTAWACGKHRKVAQDVQERGATWGWQARESLVAVNMSEPQMYLEAVQSVQNMYCKCGKAQQVCGHCRNGTESAKMRWSALKYCKTGNVEGSGKC